MATRRPSSLDRVLGRLDQLDAVNLTNLVQRLARERGLFEDIFNVLQEGVLVVDVEGVIAYANEAADQLIGLGGGKDLAGQTLWRQQRPLLLAALAGLEASSWLHLIQDGDPLPKTPRLLRRRRRR